MDGLVEQSQNYEQAQEFCQNYQVEGTVLASANIADLVEQSQEIDKNYKDDDFVWVLANTGKYLM